MSHPEPEEFESIDDMLEEEIDSMNDGIESHAQQFITEENRESEGILIDEVFREEGIPEHISQKLTERGVNYLEGQTIPKEITTKERFFHPSKTGGSEGSPRPYNYPTKVEERKDPSWPKGDKSAYQPTQREKFEAMKENRTEYLENETRRPSNDPDVIKHREKEEEKTLEQLEDIEKQLDVLPPDPEEESIEIEDVSDEEAQADGWRDNHERKHWKEGTAGHDQFLTETSKKQKLNAIGRLSVGVENEDLGECGSAQRRIVARAHLPSHMLPENRTQPYDIEELEEALRLEAEDNEDEDVEDESFEDDSEEE